MHANMHAYVHMLQQSNTEANTIFFILRYVKCCDQKFIILQKPKNNVHKYGANIEALRKKILIYNTY